MPVGSYELNDEWGRKDIRCYYPAIAGQNLFLPGPKHNSLARGVVRFGSNTLIYTGLQPGEVSPRQRV